LEGILCLAASLLCRARTRTPLRPCGDCNAWGAGLSPHDRATRPHLQVTTRLQPKPPRHGEIVSHGEIERRRTQARHRGACLGSRDARPLKQFLEALQLKGLLYHTAHLPPAPICTALPPPNAHSRRAPVQSRVAAGASRGQAGTEISWCCDSHCFPPSAASSRVAT
jgi:hypothetical protein